MDQDTFELVFSVMLSIVGLGYCAYGRKNNPYYLISGLCLLIFPMFVENFWLLLGLGCALIILPYILDR